MTTDPLKTIHLCKEGWRLYDVMCSIRVCSAPAMEKRKKARFDYLVHREKCDECAPPPTIQVEEIEK